MDTSPAAIRRAQPWQFSLKHLLIWLAAVSILLAPVHYFGGPYLFSVGCSLALIFLCNRIYRSSPTGAVLVAMGGLLFGAFLAMAVMTFAIHAFFNFLACLCFAAAGVRAKRFVAALGLTMFTVYGLILYSAVTEVRKLIVLKASTPFESLADRLAFEGNSTVTKSTSNQPIQFTAAISKQLDEQDEDHGARRFRRAWALEQLHEHTASQFERAAGFGFARMPYVTPSSIELEPRLPMVLPAKVTITPLDAEFTSLESLHKTATYNFVNPERMGFIRSRDEVSGFEAHGLSSLDREECGIKKTPDWQVTRLELVSLLRHTKPRVYVAKSLPQMDDLANVPSRPLNKFENKALSQLTAQKNVVVNDGHDRIEMLGALRAGKTCLECHLGDRGKLLGAFSYELVPVPVAENSAANMSSAILAASSND